jgi:hypothetical protein
MIMLLLALGLTGCALEKSERFDPNVYAQISSTCNLPMTYISVTTNDPFVGDKIIPFNMGQTFLNSTCRVLTKGHFIIEGSTLTVEFTEEKTTGACTTEHFAWDSTYTVMVENNTVTLTNNSCTSVYKH